MMNPLLCVLLVFVVCINAAKQTYVDISNITAALEVAEDGDELLLLNGIYPNLEYVVYNVSLSFASASGNSADVIFDGQGNNEANPLMIYYNETDPTLPLNRSVSLSISGITFVNGGSFVGEGDHIFIGGSIYINSSAIANVTVDISNCVFNGGYADFGGVIFSESLGSTAPQGPVFISVSDSVFTGNRAYQGIIYVDEATIEITNCTFYNSSVTNVGGIFLAASTLTFTDSNFTNSAGGYFNGGIGGTALFVDPSSSAYISGSNFVTNEARLAGTIYSQGTLSVLASTFEDNKVLVGTDRGSLGGGALTTLRGQLTIVNSTFRSNVAVDDGGALFLIDTPANISGTWFTLNHGDLGGAIIFHEGSATLRDCEFTLNTAQSGGALFAVNGAEVIVYNSIITQNGAIMGGGGIYAMNSSVTFADGVILNNNGNQGGAVFVGRSGSIHLERSSVTENSAKQGPSIYCTGGSIYVVNSTVASSASRQSEKNGVFCNNALPAVNCNIIADSESGDWNNVCINRGTGGNGSNGGGGFPAWAIALIVVLSVAAIVCVIGLIYYMKKRKQKASDFSKM